MDEEQDNQAASVEVFTGTGRVQRVLVVAGSLIFIVSESSGPPRSSGSSLLSVLRVKTKRAGTNSSSHLFSINP